MEIICLIEYEDDDDDDDDENDFIISWFILKFGILIWIGQIWSKGDNGSIFNFEDDRNKEWSDLFSFELVDWSKRCSADSVGTR